MEDTGVTKCVCIKCGQGLSNLSNLRRHVESFHPEEHTFLISRKKKRICMVNDCHSCERIFKDKFNLKKHMEFRGQPIRNLSKETKHFCRSCKRYYSYYNYRRHLKRMHNIQFGKQSTSNFDATYIVECLRDHQYPKMFQYVKSLLPLNKNSNPLYLKQDKCSLCDLSSDRNKLLSHYRDEHEIEIQTTKYTFTSLEDFFNWKISYEKETSSQFIKDYNVLRNQHIYKGYKCHHSGRNLSQSMGVGRIKKSIKIGGYCPASIKLKKNDFDKYDVHVVKTHVGHELDIRQLNTTILDQEKGDPVLSKRRLTKEMQNVQRQHISLKMSLNLVTSMDDGWNVLSEDLKQVYVVQKIKENCESSLKCLEYEDCAHQYICSCIDSSMKHNVCKHIHLICRYTKNQNERTSDDNESCDMKEHDSQSTELETMTEMCPSTNQKGDANLAEERTTEDDMEENDTHLTELTALEQMNRSGPKESVGDSTTERSLNRKCKGRLDLKELRTQLTKEINQLKKRLKAEDPDELLAIQRCVASIKSKLNGL